MGITSNNIVELGAICQGLLLAGSLGFRFIHLEIDFMTVLSWLTNNKDIPPVINPLLCDYRNLMERDWIVKEYHIFHEANNCTDALAKRGNEQQCLLETYDTCPAFAYTAFVQDMEHIGTTRMCNVNDVMHAVI